MSQVQKDIESTTPPDDELKPHLTVETPAEDPAPTPADVEAKFKVTETRQQFWKLVYTLNLIN